MGTPPPIGPLSKVKRLMAQLLGALMASHSKSARARYTALGPMIKRKTDKERALRLQRTGFLPLSFLRALLSWVI